MQGVTEAFKACPAPEKLNLGVGAYRDDNLKPVVLQVGAPQPRAARSEVRVQATRRGEVARGCDAAPAESAPLLPRTSAAKPRNPQRVPLAPHRAAAAAASRAAAAGCQTG